MTTAHRGAAGMLRVRTREGDVLGQPEQGALVFRGIRYAAPPVGELRFAPPAPFSTATGVPLQFEGALAAPPRAAPAPLQNTGMMLGSRPVGATAEDCLFLDVFTPALDGRRPVMVWIYGGGFVGGSGVDVLTHGSRLAALGDVVVVTFNYRLGALGFLHWDEAGDGPTAPRCNLGLRDQLAVLRWVQAEITAFGGDPDCVTVFGESAGGMSVCDLLASPHARALAHRAIAQSGGAESVQSADAARAVHADMAAALGVRAQDVEALRACSVERLLMAQQQALLAARARRGGMGFRPCVDGDVLPRLPLAAIGDGCGAAVPLLLGSTRDEQRLFINARQPLDDDELLAQVQARVRFHAEALPGSPDPAGIAREAIGRYRAGHPGAAFGNLGVWCAIDTDLGFRLPALRLAQARACSGAASWLYLWTWASPALRGWLGACHAIDVPFVFANLDAPGMKRFAGSGPEAQALARAVATTWAGFARAGSPPQPEWQPFSGNADPLLVIDADPRVADAPDAALVRFWAQAGLC